MFLITCHSEELKCKPLKQNLQTQEIKQAHLTLHCDHVCWKTIIQVAFQPSAYTLDQCLPEQGLCSSVKQSRIYGI